MGEPRTATVVLLLIAALLCAQPSAGDTAATVQWQDAPIGWGKWFVGAGSSGVCAINATGHAWCFGQQADASGALKAVTTPQPVPSALRWLLLAAGAGGANCGIAYQPGANSSQPQDPWAPQGGDLYCWGQNRAGLFGAEHAAVRSSAAPLRLDPLDGAALLDVDVGPTSACARAMDLSLFCWGQNGVGQLGNGTVSPAGAAVLEPVQVVNPRAPEPGSYWMNFAVGDSFVCGVATWPAACGNDNAAIRCSDYGVYCFGSNARGQLGTNGTGTGYSPVPVPIDTSNMPARTPGEYALTNLNCGDAACCVLLQLVLGGNKGAFSEVYCWGDAFSTPSSRAPVAVPSDVQFGRLLPPQTVNTSGVPSTRACGVDYTMQVYCFEATSNATGTYWTPPQRVPGIGRLASEQVASNSSLTVPMLLFGSFAAGRDFSCVQTSGNASAGQSSEVLCWGGNALGQLGRGYTNASYSEAAAPVVLPALPGATRRDGATGDPAPTPASSASGSLSTGAVIGIALGCAACAALALVTAVLVHRKRAARSVHVPPVDKTPPGTSKFAGVDDDPLLSFLLKHGSLLGPETCSGMSTSSASVAGSGAGQAASQQPGLDLSPWEIPFTDLALQCRIGQGSCGKVFLASYHESEVAVKVLLSIEEVQRNPSAALSQSHPVMAGLRKEAGIISKLNHPNVLQMLGVCMAPPAIVTEYCANGSLSDVLFAARADRDSPTAHRLTVACRLSMALDAARGVLFLHSRQPPIIHRDLKSPNLLCDVLFRVKIADFDLSKESVEGAAVSSVATATNPRWLGPEVLRGEKPTAASDTFAFGIILWELVSWKLPWEGLTPWQIVEALRSGRRPEWPLPGGVPGPDPAAYERMRGDYEALAGECWAQDPAERPSFDGVIQRLKVLLDSALEAERAARGMVPSQQEQ